MSRQRAKGRQDSDNCLIVGRTVNFNLKDEYQRNLYEATLDWTNFSGRVKRLLNGEINGGLISSAFTRSSPPDITNEEGEPYPAILEVDEYDPVAQLFGRAI